MKETSNGYLRNPSWPRPGKRRALSNFQNTASTEANESVETPIIHRSADRPISAITVILSGVNAILGDQL